MAVWHWLSLSVFFQLTYRYEQLRLEVVDFHVSVLTSCLQHADYLADLAGDPFWRLYCCCCTLICCMRVSHRLICMSIRIILYVGKLSLSPELWHGLITLLDTDVFDIKYLKLLRQMSRWFSYFYWRSKKQLMKLSQLIGFTDEKISANVKTENYSVCGIRS